MPKKDRVDDISKLSKFIGTSGGRKLISEMKLDEIIQLGIDYTHSQHKPKQSVGLLILRVVDIFKNGKQR